MKDTNAQLRKDMKNVKDKGVQSDTKQNQQRVNELQTRLQQADQEKEQLHKEVVGGVYMWVWFC